MKNATVDSVKVIAMYKITNVGAHLVAWLLLMGMAAASLGGDIIYVKQGGMGAGTGWADPCGLVSAALDAADPGDSIWVAAGTYHPTAEVGGTGSRYHTFQLKNGVSVYGGFANTGDPAWEDRDPDQYPTILSGDLLDNDKARIDLEELLNDPCRADNCYHVFYHPTGMNLDANAVLDGFVITGGNANAIWLEHRGNGGGMFSESNNPTVTNCNFSDNSAYYGGGMYNTNNSTVAVTNCTFSGCWAGSGAGMYNSNSSPTVTESTFSGCWAASGAGMYNTTNSSPTVTDCTFSSNATGLGGVGGGMRNADNSSPTVSKCVFSGNSAQHGGGMYNGENSSPMVTRCTFSGNWTYPYYHYRGGGGMYNDNSAPTVTRCAFSGNWAARSGGGMYNYSSSVTVTDCSFSGNKAYDGDGGGMFNEFSSLTVINCSFSGNYAREWEYGSCGPGMVNAASDATITNCIFWGNIVGLGDGGQICGGGGLVSYNDIAECGGSGAGWDTFQGIDGGGNIDIDPIFVNALGSDGVAGTADDDLHLLLSSPCIDAGDPNYDDANNPADIDGFARVVDGDGDGTARVDMGMDEVGVIGSWHSATQCYGDGDGDGEVDTEDWPVFRDSFGYAWPDGSYDARGDLDRDGDVDTTDWPAFRDHFGYMAPADCRYDGVWPPGE